MPPNGMLSGERPSGRPSSGGAFSTDSRGLSYFAGPMKAIRISVTAAAALALVAGRFVTAREAPSPPVRVAARRLAPQAAARVSMDQAVMLVEQRYKAKVVRAETQTQGDRTIYVLRMLDGAGRVFAVRVDAASGTIL